MKKSVLLRLYSRGCAHCARGLSIHETLNLLFLGRDPTFDKCTDQRALGLVVIQDTRLADAGLGRDGLQGQICGAVSDDDALRGIKNRLPIDASYLSGEGRLAEVGR